MTGAVLLYALSDFHYLQPILTALGEGKVVDLLQQVQVPALARPE